MAAGRIIPIRALAAAPEASRQRLRRWTQATFFAFFVLAPVFNVLRYDLPAGHAWLLGFEWHAGLDDLLCVSKVAALGAVGRIFGRVILPVFALGGLLMWAAWRWGRLYCGWLCPHFSVVETINRLMLFATGKHSVWDKKQTPPWEPDGTPMPRDWRYWFAVVPAAIGFAFAWAVVGLTYLMPPFQVYGGLLNFTLLRWEVIFLCAATTVLTLEFLFARHLFCRYGCSVGILQSLAWMSNRRALVVGTERSRLAECATCLDGQGSACDAVCPMRLKPRSIKRLMFACTQCAQCVAACATVQTDNPGGGLLAWVQGEEARQLEGGFKAPRPPRASERGPVCGKGSGEN